MERNYAHSMPRHNSLVILMILLVSTSLGAIDISIVVTALPRIQNELHASAEALSWVQSAYTLTFGGLLLLGARAGDILGRKRMYLIGMCLFTASSFAIGLAHSLLWLIW